MGVPLGLSGPAGPAAPALESLRSDENRDQAVSHWGPRPLLPGAGAIFQQTQTIFLWGIKGSKASFQPETARILSCPQASP